MKIAPQQPTLKFRYKCGLEILTSLKTKAGFRLQTERMYDIMLYSGSSVLSRKRRPSLSTTKNGVMYLMINTPVDLILYMYDATGIQTF